MRWFFLTALLMPACLETATTQCEGGLVCPAGTACFAAGSRCVDVAFLEACNGADTGTCSVNGQIGTCVLGECVVGWTAARDLPAP